MLANSRTNVQFVQGTKSNQACLVYNNKRMSCLGKGNETLPTQIKDSSDKFTHPSISGNLTIKQIQSCGDSFALIDNTNRLRLYLRDLTFNGQSSYDGKLTNQVQFSNKRMYILQESNLHVIKDQTIVLTHLASGQRHNCGGIINISTKIVACWGRNDYAQTEVPEYFLLNGLTLVRGGESHTCASLNKSGIDVGDLDSEKLQSRLLCWGRSEKGQSEVPATLESGADLLALGQSHTCASVNSKLENSNNLDNTGEVIDPSGDTLLCWGQSFQGQTDFSVQQSELHQGVDLLAAGYYHSCASKDGVAQCWGRDSQSQVQVPEEMRRGWDELNGHGEDMVVALAAGGSHSCASTSRLLLCWGSNNSGQLGVPGRFRGGVKMLETGFNHVCAVGLGAKEEESGEAGDGGEGANGATETATDSILEQVSDPDSLLPTPDAPFGCWGGTVQNQSMVPDSLLYGVSLVSTGDQHTCAAGSGYFACWGLDDSDQLLIPNSLSDQTPDSLVLEDVRSFRSTGEYDMCYMQDKMMNLVTCLKSPALHSQSHHIQVHEEMWCMVTQSDVEEGIKSDDRPLLCQVSDGWHNRLVCIDLAKKEHLEFDNSTGIDDNGEDSSDYLQLDESISKLSCGFKQVCVLGMSGKVTCLFGSSVGEGILTDEMVENNLDVYTGEQRTCVLKQTDVICIGIPLSQNVKYKLDELMIFQS